MAQDFKLNGTTIARITRGDWDQSQAGGTGLDGTSARQRWVRHVWAAEVLTAAEFNTLYAAMGTLCSIDTPTYGGRNGADYQRYFGVKCLSVTGRHEGPNFEGVTAEFEVRV